MNRFQFLLAKITGHESRLSTLSVPIQTIYDEITGKSVALVGNARGLAQSRHGVRIDQADHVVRLNAAPMPDAASHGTRTDWIATSIPLDQSLIASRGSPRILWMTPRRKRLQWTLARNRSFFLNPLTHQEELSKVLGSRPSTGVLILDLLQRSQAAQVDIYGFDFFASLSLSGSRKANDVAHDFNAEQEWVMNLMRQDLRFRLHAHH